MKAVRKTILATSLLAVLPGLGHALGLGGIDVKSGLNEPLVAEIQVIIAAPDEREGLKVGLARPEDFANVGLDYSRMSMPLDFAITTNAKGETIVRVTSDEVIREPFLSLLLEVNWAKGRLLREYSLLLDPPVMASVRKGSSAVTQPVVDAPAPAPQPLTPAPTAPAPTAQPVAAAPAPAARPTATPTPTPTPPPALAAVDSRPAPAPAPAKAPAPAATGGEYGPVAAGENLYAIAQRVREQSGAANLDQLMVSILRMNPQAFYQDNVNALKSGAILRIPSGSELVSVDDARSAVQEHNQLWTGYQARSSENPSLLSDAGTASVAGSPRSAASTQDRLELVAPGSSERQGGADRPNGRADAASAQQLRKAADDLALAKEELSSARRESGELGSRVQELERLQNDQTRLIGLKDDRIAELERRIKEMEAAERAAKAAAATAVAAVPAVPEPAPVTTQPEPAPEATPPDPAPLTTADVSSAEASSASSAPADTAPITKEDIWGQSLDASSEPATVDDPFAAEPVDAEPADSASEDVAAAPADATAEPATAGPTVTPIPEPVKTPPVTIAPVQAPEPSFIELYWPWLAGGGGVLLLLGLLSALRRKKPAVAAADAAAGEQGFEQEFQDDGHLGFPGAQSEQLGGIPTPPPFEAFDADPEMALRAGIEADPDDLQCHLELLRLFYRKRDTDAFEDAAQAMLARVPDPGLSAEWQEARSMGEALVPNSALFAQLSDFDTLDLPALGSETEALPADDGLGDLDFGSFDAPAPAASPSLDKPLQSQADEPLAFDFNLDLDGPTRQVEPVRVEATVSAPAPAPAPAADDLSFDFNLDLDSPADPLPPAPAPVSPAPAVAEFDAPSLDLPDFDFDSDIKPVERVSFEPTEIASPVAPEPTSSLPEPEIIREPELPAFDDALFSSDDAVGTKLDLARAYLDMGDPDGARSMLEEVMAEGDDVQRNEARELLGRLG